jgi:hypothetical protein
LPIAVGTARAGEGVGDALGALFFSGTAAGAGAGGALPASASAISGGSLSRPLGAAIALDT